MSGTPNTTFKAPAGSPASVKARARAMPVAGVSSDGLAMTVQPAARAAAILRTGVMMGKFQGVSERTTPTGSVTIMFREWLSRPGIIRPYARLPSSANHSMVSTERITSPFDSGNVLPCSRVKSSATWSARSRKIFAASLRISPRFQADVLRHSIKAFSAALRASSISSADA